MTLSDKVNNRCPNKKSGRTTELTEEQEKGLRFYIEYMASINHPLYISAVVKAFAWSIVIKASDLNTLMHKQDLEISGVTTSRKGTTSLIENSTILIMINPGRLILLCTNNTFLCWKKSSMIWSWQRSLKIFLIVMSPWLLLTGKVVSRKTKQAYTESKKTRGVIIVTT